MSCINTRSILQFLSFVNIIHSVTIEPIGDWEIIWDYQTQRCTNVTIPDSPPRAFRIHNNNIEFLTGNHGGFYQARGPTLSNLTEICKQQVIISGLDGYSVPSDYNNSLWIESVWRNESDENIVHAIVHNEFHAERQYNKSLCPSSERSQCGFWNGLCAKSIDGGNTFNLYSNMTQRTCMVTPFKYIPDNGTQGYGRISNILYNPINDSYHYLWIMRHTPNLDKANGVCLWRNSDLNDPNGWRAWNKTSNLFDIKSVDPYLQDDNNNFNPNNHLCDIVEQIPDYFARTWTFNNVINQYIQIGINVGAGYIQYQYSKNIFDWSDPINLLPSNFTNGPHHVIYPSLLDESSDGLNFEYTNQNPWLYLVRSENKTGDARDVIRIKLKVSN